MHLRLFDKAQDEERFEHLRVVFKLAESVVSERPRISLAYKLAADSLLRVIKFRDDIMMNVGVSGICIHFLNVDRPDLFRYLKAGRFLTVYLQWDQQ